MEIKNLCSTTKDANTSIVSSEKFNVFNVLGKDDEELIHSSFLKFLIEESNVFSKQILGISNNEISTITLEKGIDKQRFDLFIELKNGGLIIIENKFKMLPYWEQIDKYNKLLKKNYKKVEIQKILICFDKETIDFSNGMDDWQTYDYADIARCMSVLNDVNDREKCLFIEHYSIFIQNYIDTYSKYKTNSSQLFHNPQFQENKFWLKLIYSLIRNKFSELRTGVKINYVIPSNTSVPLLNIIPSHWKQDGIELLIQFQGSDVKFYAHTEDKDFVQNLVDRAQDVWDADNDGKFKKITKAKSNSQFIYKENLTNVFSTEDFTIENIVTFLNGFYAKIEQVLVIR